MPRLRYYISGHGLGHASRSCQVLSTLHSLFPQISFDVVTDAPAWFLTDNLPTGTPVRRRRLDIGVVQANSLQMHLEQTLNDCLDLLTGSPELVETEVQALCDDRIDLVVTDVAALPCLAARQAACRAVVLSNFTWDWIYEAFIPQHPRFREVANWHQQAYAQAELALRLPFHSPLDQMARRIDLPLVARIGRTPATEIRAQIGLTDKQCLGLLSFGGFGLDHVDLDRLSALPDWVFLAEPALARENPRLNPLPKACSYPDLVNAADVVITKPGYGIVAECIANRTSVLYTSRGNFREQTLLVEGLQRYTRAREISLLQLQSGDWQDDLTALLQQPQPTTQIALNGAEAAARQLAALLT